MDLKDVIQTVVEQADEAQRAFHAGHHEDAEEYLAEIGRVIDDFEPLYEKPEPDVTEKATSETPTETLRETQAKVAGEGVHPAVIDPAAAAQQNAPGPEAGKQSQ